jgi:hypothetical protein
LGVTGVTERLPATRIEALDVEYVLGQRKLREAASVGWL